jgi:RHS repeat-associated protein
VNYGYNTLGHKTRNWVGTNAASSVDDTQYGYDTLGRLFTVTVLRRDSQTLATPEVTTYRYDLLGNLASVTLPNGVVSRYVYDNLNRLTNLTHFAPDSTPTDSSDNATVIESFAYHLRTDGRRDRETTTLNLNGAAQTTVIDWTYDDIGRLIAESFDSSDNSLDYTDGYTFDLTGNRRVKTHDAGHDGSVDETTSYNYDANDRLLAESLDRLVGVDTLTAYSFSGTQQTGKTSYAELTPSLNSRLSTLDFTYDLQGRLSVATATTFDGSTGTATRNERTTYGYDATGIRVSAMKEDDANADGTFETRVHTEFLNDPQDFTGYSQVIRETHTDPATGQILKSVAYTFGLDEISQTTTEFTNGQPSQSATLFFGHDGHGSVRVLFDVAGAIATLASVPQVYTFDAYGNAVGFNVAQAVTSLLYSGEQFDQRVMMQYLRARFYDALTGRFNGLDSFAGNMQDPQSLHKYLYTHDDPIAGTDPTGKMTLGSIQIACGTFMNLVAIRVGPVIAAGGAALGRFWRQIGWASEQFANLVFQMFQRLQVLAHQPIGTRIIDFVLKMRDRTALLEVKYSLPTNGAGFSRLIGQIQAMVSSGQGQAVVWTMQRPGLSELNRIQAAVGSEVFTRVQFVDGIWGLHQWILMYFGR